ncbi:DoxX family protein, partial [Arthrobacter sp. SIMBA_036]|uniref:DoxX family protein n=1 Tax=Arthrobacter sp. SIMBA_036 TaxID=3085778 RepID=UPI00397D9403
MTLSAPDGRGFAHTFKSAAALLDRIPHDLIATISRLSIAAVFWQSGQTKVDGWQVTDNAVYLFQTEYKLPLVDPWLAAHLAAFAEHFFPLLL